MEQTAGESLRGDVGGVVNSWLVCSSRDRAVRVRMSAGDITLTTLTVSLSSQEYK